MSESIHPIFEPANLSDQERSRLHNLEALVAAGIEPYPARVKRTHTVADARALFERGDAGEDAVTVTGRIKRMRIMGKMSFADLEDGTGSIQLVLRKDSLPANFYDDVWKKLIDLGDFVGATGPLVVTKTGELSVDVREVQFLSKALKPMPDKWHGVRDQEKRYRRRYVDLLANPPVRDIFRTRAVIVRALRDFLDGEGFLEVETPILQPLYGGAAARPFVTHHNQLHQDLYLRISFELYLKRLIVGGYDRVYEIGRDFRNEGVSFKHNPEFTQLEFYEAYADYQDVMRRTEEMVAHVARQVTGGTTITWQGHTVDLTPPWRRLPLREAILEATDIDYEAYPDAESLAAEMRRLGHDPDPRSNWGKLVDSLMAKHVEPHLIQPTFLTDYPLDVSPLAKGSPDDPRLVERFEGFMVGMEICNAFSELNDPIDQLRRFIDEAYRARHGDEEAHPVDEDYIEALSYGMPPTGGFGMGVDRLTMILTDTDTIREVILFPHLRTIREGGEEEEGAGEDVPSAQ
ncbi:MAG: lysine--tRNA ligase [Caldilinea sp.]|nr:lysine--tRNA ligase [Caldilineaceae bacterium]MCB9120855.1 lysine--tRNA ligase [Caldilineaceae bacterium]MCB9123932.1 lysine--tRNA ligase [Caldilineaceae bacterium]MCO5209795.1 lysine--tRNA ligase [Caldilinea sp.]